MQRARRIRAGKGHTSKRRNLFQQPTRFPALPSLLTSSARLAHGSCPPAPMPRVAAVAATMMLSPCCISAASESTLLGTKAALLDHGGSMRRPVRPGTAMRSQRFTAKVRACAFSGAQQWQ